MTFSVQRAIPHERLFRRATDSRKSRKPSSSGNSSHTSCERQEMEPADIPSTSEGATSFYDALRLLSEAQRPFNSVIWRYRASIYPTLGCNPTSSSEKPNPRCLSKQRQCHNRVCCYKPIQLSRVDSSSSIPCETRSGHGRHCKNFRGVEQFPKSNTPAAGALKAGGQDHIVIGTSRTINGDLCF